MRQRNQRSLAIFALAMALIATSVAYAVLQTSLNISASVTRKGGSWDIAITEIGLYGRSWMDADQVIGTVSSSSEIELGENVRASVNGTKASIKVTLNPNESVKMYVEVSNRGTLNAQLGDFYLQLSGGQNVTTSDQMSEMWNGGKAVSSDGHLTVQINEMLSDYLSGAEKLVFTITYDDLGKTELTSATDDIYIGFNYRQA